MMSDFQPLKVPYHYRKAVGIHTNLKGYWVRLYLLFDGEAVYYFKSQEDQLENAFLIAEIAGLEHVTCIDKEILVTPDKHSDMYNEIVAYENAKQECV